MFILKKERCAFCFFLVVSIEISVRNRFLCTLVVASGFYGAGVWVASDMALIFLPALCPLIPCPCPRPSSVHQSRSDIYDPVGPRSLGTQLPVVT